MPRRSLPAVHDAASLGQYKTCVELPIRLIMNTSSQMVISKPVFMPANYATSSTLTVKELCGLVTLCTFGLNP